MDKDKTSALTEMLAALARAAEESSAPSIPATRDELSWRAEFFDNPDVYSFKRGDFVKMRSELRGITKPYAFPGPDEIALVLAVRDTDFIPCESGMPYRRSNMLVLVRSSRSGDFERYAVDPVYFEKADAKPE